MLHVLIRSHFPDQTPGVDGLPSLYAASRPRDTAEKTKRGVCLPCESRSKRDFNRVREADGGKCSVRNVEARCCQVASPHLKSACALKTKNKEPPHQDLPFHSPSRSPASTFTGRCIIYVRHSGGKAAALTLR